MTLIFKKLIIGFISLLALLAFSTFAYADQVKKINNSPENRQTKAIPLDSIAAIVNKRIITQSELDKQVAMIKRRLAQTNTPIPSEPVLKKQVLQHLIDVQLQLQQARKQGISVSNDELNTAIANIAAGNHTNVDTLRNYVKDKLGLSYADYRDEIREQILINSVQQQSIAKQITVNANEVNSYIHDLGNAAKEVPEYHLQTILIPLPEAPTPAQVDAANDRANNILAQLKKGANFRKTAIANSEGPQALKGGDMGWQQIAQLPPPLAKRLAHAKAGAIIGPMQTSVGFYIINYVAKRRVPVRHYVEQYHVRRILVKLNELTDSKEAKGQLEKIRDEIIRGKSFSKMAETYSQDPASANRGGDIGWVDSQKVPHIFAEEMQRLQPGEISRPFLSQDGWQVIEVLGERRVNDTHAFLENNVKQYIYQRKYQEAVQRWLQQLRGDAYIKIL